MLPVEALPAKHNNLGQANFLSMDFQKAKKERKEHGKMNMKGEAGSTTKVAKKETADGKAVLGTKERLLNVKK